MSNQNDLTEEVWYAVKRAKKDIDPGYLMERGAKIARVVIAAMHEGIALRRAPIFPGKRISKNITWEDRIQSAYSPTIVTDEQSPIVIGFLNELGACSVDNIQSTHIVRDTGFIVRTEQIAYYDDYKQEEVEGMVGGVMLPAVRVNFLPPVMNPSE